MNLPPIAIQTRGSSLFSLERRLRSLRQELPEAEILLAMPLSVEPSWDLNALCTAHQAKIFRGAEAPFRRLYDLCLSTNADRIIRLVDDARYASGALIEEMVQRQIEMNTPAVVSAANGLFSPVEILTRFLLEELKDDPRPRVGKIVREMTGTGAVIHPLDNMEAYLERAMESFYTWPSRLIVELTNHCNLACPMCARHHMSASKGFMSPDLFRSIVDQIPEGALTEFIPFMRGESFLHKEILPLLAYAKTRPIGKMLLTTNGMLLSEENSRALLKMGLDGLNVSIDCVDKAVYERIRINARFETVIENLRRFAEMKRSIGAKTKITVAAVKMEGNNSENEKKDFIRFFDGIADQITFYGKHTVDGVFGRLHDRSGIPKKKSLCASVLTDLAVYWNGDAALCCQDWDRKRTLGNAARQSSQEIWQGELYKEVRRLHAKGDLNRVETCAQCDYWSHGVEINECVVLNPAP